MPHTMKRRNIVILTAGYNGNLGDQALAYCSANLCIEAGFRPILADYERANRHTANQQDMPALMLGGELGDIYHFRTLQSLQPDPSLAAIGGISIANTFISHPDTKLLAYLKQTRCFFVRDKTVKETARKQLDIQHIKYAPDIVFSIAERLSNNQPAKAVDAPKGTKTIIGINAQAFFLKMRRNGSFSPLDSNPFGSAEEASKAEYGYRRALHALIRYYQQRGHKVINYSFCIQDTIYFKRYFHNLGCDTLEFFWDFEKLISSISQCSLFFASRYHAHIAAMIAGLPTVSMMVGAKNRGLLLDMEINPDRHQIDRESFLNHKDCVDRIQSLEPFVVPRETISTNSQRARESFREIIGTFASAA